jgi:phosphoribosylaminoimidazole (AIR) synthetase
MPRHDEYRRSGVDYDVLDDVKREAIALAAATAPLLMASSGAEVSESRGSSAYVFEVNGTTLALVVDRLGTKSIIRVRLPGRDGVEAESMAMGTPSCVNKVKRSGSAAPR